MPRLLFLPAYNAEVCSQERGRRVSALLKTNLCAAVTTALDRGPMKRNVATTSTGLPRLTKVLLNYGPHRPALPFKEAILGTIRNTISRQEHMKHLWHQTADSPVRRCGYWAPC